MSLDRKFNEDSKNVLKTVIFVLQVSLTSDFDPNCPWELSFWQFNFLHHISPWLYLIF